MLPFTVLDLLEQNLPTRADHPAVVDGDTEVTYGELVQEVETVASWLHSAGVRRGDRVAIWLHKSVEEVVATFAIARVGAVFVNVNYQWTLAQFEHVREDCGFRVLITDERRAMELHESGTATDLDGILVQHDSPEESVLQSWSELPPPGRLDRPRTIDADLAALLYTSGSTGKPKGVMLSHSNVVLGAKSVARYLENTADDRILSFPPLSFDYGLNQVTTAFLVGATVVLQKVAMPAEIVRTVSEKKVTGLAAVPTAWIQVVNLLLALGDDRPPLSLRYVTNTGGKIPHASLEAMPKVFPGVQIYLMYGLTEAFRSTYLPPELFEEKMGAIGQAIPNVEIFVVDREDGVQGPGGKGELIHRGSLISGGYWGAPEATDAKIKTNEHLRPLIGSEKVLHSGDLVRLDDDGCLWFVGRADSMIKCSGFRLSPTEVEEIVYQSGLVAQVVAFGVPDDLLGEVVHIAVSGPDGEPVESPGLMAFCQGSMPRYMVPARIWPWEGSMPQTSSGKIDRPTVIEACRAAGR